jgi:hypothetical protein
MIAVRARLIRVNAESEGGAAAVVFLPDMGEVDVAHLVLVVKRHQQPAITNGNVSRHRERSFRMKLNPTDPLAARA